MSKQIQGQRLKLGQSNAVLVTGSAGYIGSHLVKSLAESGASVVAMYRTKLPELGQGVFPVCSDLSSTDLIAAPLRGVGTVVYLAHDRRLKKTGCIRQSENVQSLKNLVSAMEQSKTNRIIYVSSAGAGPMAKSLFLREKYESELCVLNSRIPERIIVRPTLVFGVEGGGSRFISVVKRMMRFPFAYPVPSFKRKLRPLYINDLVHFLQTLVDAELKQKTGIVDIAGEGSYKISEVLKVVSKTYGNPSQLPLHSIFGRTLAFFIERGVQRKQHFGCIGDFLSLASDVDPRVQKENPLVELMPKGKVSFEEAIRATNSKPEPN